MKAIAILSGGLDSTTSLYKAIANGYELLEAISFDYGQKHKLELTKAAKTCEKLGIKHKIVDVTCLTSLLDSALTRDDIEVPEGHYAEDNMKATVVPNRNMIMTAIAAGRAMTLKADTLILGVHQGDHTIYPDCRIEFIQAMAAALALADWHSVTIYAPFLATDKTGIVKEGLALNVPFEDTLTCYKGGEVACGKCGSCTERKESFEKNNAIDPIQYA